MLHNENILNCKKKKTKNQESLVCQNKKKSLWKAGRLAAGSCDKPGRRGELMVRRKGRRAYPAASYL